MIKLSREVRFAIPSIKNGAAPIVGANGFGGVPPVESVAPFCTLAVTLSGALDPVSGYLINIKRIDSAARQHVIPMLAGAMSDDIAPKPALLVARIYELLQAWPPLSLESVKLNLSPFAAYGMLKSERPMIRMSQKFEFSASHRLHHPSLSDNENRRLFGKCNNPHGHGHNYELQVALRGEPDEAGRLIAIAELEKIVSQNVIERFDHKNLNEELPEFRQLIPTVENIAMTIFRILKPQFQSQRAKLASVTLWETPKTWCEYSE